MTTPAGWYDDGSGRQRWWDGTQWTEHFAPLTATEASSADETSGDASSADSVDAGHDGTSAADTDAAVPVAGESAAAADTAASLESVAAVENSSWNTPASDDAAASTETPAEEVAAPEPAATEASDPWSAPESRGEQTEAPQSEGFTAPGATAPTTPLGGDVSPYGNAAPSYPAGAGAPSYPGAAPQQQQQAYPTAPGQAGAPGYPGASAYAPAGQAYGASGYPPAYGATAPAAPARLSILGLVGLGLAALGTILSCIPVIFWFGWLLLGAGFIVSLISLFLKGKKWPGISGLILSVVGAIIAVVMFFVIVFAAVSEAARDLPSAPPSSDSDTDNGTDPGTEEEDTDPTDVAEGELGEAVTIEQMSGTSEVTINSATWATTDGSSIPSTNGGYVILDVTFTGVSGTSYVNPFYVMVETAEGAEGDYDYYVDGIVAEELAAGDTVSGTMTYDVAQSSSYVIIFTDELLQEVARVSVTPSAG